MTSGYGWRGATLALLSWAAAQTRNDSKVPPTLFDYLNKIECATKKVTESLIKAWCVFDLLGACPQVVFFLMQGSDGGLRWHQDEALLGKFDLSAR